MRKLAFMALGVVGLGLALSGCTARYYDRYGYYDRGNDGYYDRYDRGYADRDRYDRDAYRHDYRDYDDRY